MGIGGCCGIGCGVGLGGCGIGAGDGVGIGVDVCGDTGIGCGAGCDGMSGVDGLLFGFWSIALQYLIFIIMPLYRITYALPNTYEKAA